VETRWRGVAVNVAGRPVSFDLIDSVERDVQPIATLVLDDRDFNRALADEDRLEAAVDANSVLEVDDEVAGFERGDRLERGTGRIAPCAAKPSLSTEDFMVCENAEAR
jgi:hypothetical protein